MALRWASFLFLGAVLGVSVPEGCCEPSVGKVTHKVVDDSLEVLICQAFGFYPKEIQANWMRDGEVCKYETLPRNVAPNSDGTYYIWLCIEIDPKERHHFQCYLQHISLQEPLVLAFKEESGWRWRCRKKRHQEVTTCPDQISLEMLPSPASAEDEIQS